MTNEILVVDDEQETIDYITALLEDNGYAVRSAQNGVEALRQVQQRRPALILLDLQMPEETGTGFYRKLRARPELRSIPVIVISGLAGRNVAVSKSVVVLDKPLDEGKMLEEVKRALATAA